jgi:fatty acid desaturase
MDFVTALGNLNWWAVILSMGVVLLVGTVWYSNAFFGRPWIRAVGKTKVELQQGRNALWLMATTLFWIFITVVTIGLLQQFMGIVGWYDGLGLGLLVGVGLVVALSTLHGLFENRLNNLLWINAAYSLLVCVISAMILASWS